jgi:putative FmdB family regulatory protein
VVAEALDLPLYEYLCPKCGRFELIRKFSDATVTTCPTCGSEVQKLLSAPAIQFKGTGWYITDYARKDGKSGTGDAGKGSASKAEGAKSEGGKSEGATAGGGKDSGSSSGTAASTSSSTGTATKDSGGSKS